MESTQEMLDRAMAFHGGVEHWKGLAAVEVVASSSGLLFTLKRRPPRPRARMRIATREPRATFFDYPEPGMTGEWLGEEEARILDGSGRVVERREHPRRVIHQRGRMRPWDALDFLFFGAYAYWNYFNLPFLLAGEGFQLRRLPARGGLHRLAATFPDHVPTHSKEQLFWFADSGELVRHDYTAEVVGGWATASHFSGDYRPFGELRAATVRRARPRFLGSPPLPGPIIVAIDVHEVTAIAG